MAFLFSARHPAREFLAHATLRSRRCGRPVGLAAAAPPLGDEKWL
jgi:hypothetical protein